MKNIKDLTIKEKKQLLREIGFDANFVKPLSMEKMDELLLKNRPNLFNESSNSTGNANQAGSNSTGNANPTGSNSAGNANPIDGNATENKSILSWMSKNINIKRLLSTIGAVIVILLVSPLMARGFYIYSNWIFEVPKTESHQDNQDSSKVTDDSRNIESIKEGESSDAIILGGVIMTNNSATYKGITVSLDDFKKVRKACGKAGFINISDETAVMFTHAIEADTVEVMDVSEKAQKALEEKINSLSNHDLKDIEETRYADLLSCRDLGKIVAYDKGGIRISQESLDLFIKAYEGLNK